MKDHLEQASKRKRPWYMTVEATCTYILVVAVILSCLITYFFGP